MVQTSVGRENQALGKGEPWCNESDQVKRGEQQGWTGRMSGQPEANKADRK